MKRKRKGRGAKPQHPRKRRKGGDVLPTKVITHPVLRHYFPRLSTLRQYLISRLPPEATRQRHRVERIRQKQGVNAEDEASIEDDQLGALLDSAIVTSCPPGPDTSRDDCMSKDRQTFTQQCSATAAGGHGSGVTRTTQASTLSQSELVDFAIWSLFHKRFPNAQRPQHMLCHGLQRAAATWQHGLGISVGCCIPGLISMYPNDYVETLKGRPWAKVLGLLGSHGERIMLNLILDCAIFLPIGDASSGNLYQLSGQPLSELTVREPSRMIAVDQSHEQRHLPKKNASVIHKPSNIHFVRSRILHSRAALNAKGNVYFGLRHIHVLNRYPDASDDLHTVHVMKYIFPRQFGLHNVFTCKTDPKDTAHQFKDYTMREEEISGRECFQSKYDAPGTSTKFSFSAIPKRLRGEAFLLIKRLQKLHKSCSYSKLLAHYCPKPQFIQADIPSSQTDLTELACSSEKVSAFCRAVLKRVIPRSLLGGEIAEEHNWTVFLSNVDTFIKARRFETLTLEAVFQGMKISDIKWLVPQGTNASRRIAQSDFQKRNEMFLELLYYLFDSFLIPLVRSNFHVTESSVHKNRLFFFRHDVWRQLTEPSLTKLKRDLFQEIGNGQALDSLKRQTLAVSQIRLLPKGTGMRPIMNLRRRTQVSKNGVRALGKSINAAITPIFNVLNFEKTKQPDKLGASLFSVSGMYSKLRDFATLLRCSSGAEESPLYFAKVDVKACFDSLPQVKLLEVVTRMLTAKNYSISRRTEIKPREQYGSESSAFARPIRKFIAEANPAGDTDSFVTKLTELSKSHRDYTIYVDGVLPQKIKAQQVVDLLTEHVEQNIVKIGKKYYRQRQGIPQGSILSSLLCNLFLAEFERIHLGFLTGNYVLLRLIDDFLLITVDRGQALQFLQLMHDGCAEYGVAIRTEKSLVNFSASLNGVEVPRLPPTSDFPYCGMLIHTKTLDISKDNRSTNSGSASANAAAYYFVIVNRQAEISDGLTIEYSKIPGTSFRRKMLSAFKIQMHTMLLDTSYNALSTVLKNLYRALRETATKCNRYIGCMGKRQKPSNAFLSQLARDVADLALAIIRSRRNKLRNAEYKCGVSACEVKWLTATAFTRVFKSRQAKYGEFVRQSAREIEASRPGSRREAGLMHRAVEEVERGLLQR